MARVGTHHTLALQQEYSLDIHLLILLMIFVAIIFQLNRLILSEPTVTSHALEFHPLMDEVCKYQKRRGKSQKSCVS
jgi:hypothetical protein